MRGLWVVAVAAACGPPAPRGVWSRRGDLEAGDAERMVVELSDPTRQPTQAAYVANPRHRGPSRGGGCGCRRKRCTMARTDGPPAAATWCTVTEAGIKACFEAAKLSGRAVVTLRTNDRGRVEQASVEADDRVLACIYRAVHGASFFERPTSLWQVIFHYQHEPR